MMICNVNASGSKWFQGGHRGTDNASKRTSLKHKSNRGRGSNTPERIQGAVRAKVPLDSAAHDSRIQASTE